MKAKNVALSCALAFSLSTFPVAQALALTRDESTSGTGVRANIDDVAAITQQVESAGLTGSAALIAYLNNEAVSAGDFLAIDTAALSEIDASLAAEIASGQAKLIADSEDGEDGDAKDDESKDEPSEDSKEDENKDSEDSKDESKDESKEGESKDAEDSKGESKDNESNDKKDESEDKSSDSDEVNKDEAGDEVKPEKPAPSPEEKSEDAADDATEDVNESPSEEAVEDEAEEPEVTESEETSVTQGETLGIVHRVSQNLTTQKFIAIIGEQARDIAEENGLYASVMIAQAILESGSGNSTLSQNPNFNLFGIKGNYKGQSVVMRTGEDDGTGSIYYISSSFRKYDSIRESLEDYADLLTGNAMGKFYSGAWRENTQSYEDACEFLQGRYATSTTYAASLETLIESYDLTKYDEPLDYEIVDTIEVQSTDDDGELEFDEDGKPVMEERDLFDLVNELTSHLGEDYVWGGTTCGSFDCSGLVQYSYKEALGINLPRVADDQAKAGERITVESEDDLRMGDLLFFADVSGYAYHVAVYLGEGCFIHAPSAGDVVKVTSLAEQEPSFAVRIVDTQEVPEEDLEVGELTFGPEQTQKVLRSVSGIRSID